MARKMLIDGELGQTIEEEKQYDFDLFVIGAGSGGVRASRTSASFGAKVRDYDSFCFPFLFLHCKNLYFVSFVRLGNDLSQESFTIDGLAGLLSV